MNQAFMDCEKTGQCQQTQAFIHANTPFITDSDNNGLKMQNQQFHNQQQQPVRVITRIIFLQKPTSLADIIPFIIVFFIYGLLVQMGLTIWKKFHKPSHKFFQFAIVFAFSPVILYLMSDILLFVIWAAFLIFIMFCLRKVLFRPMTYEVPKEIFRTFRTLFLYTNIAILIGHVVLAFSFLLYQKTLFPSIRFFIYSLYIAVLSREVVLNLSHVMAIRTGYYSKEGISGLQDNAEICMICTAKLSNAESIVTLYCQHAYHEECIRGWSLIAQNKFCPYCKKGIDSAFFAPELWERAELPFKPLMNLARSFISFFLVVLCVVMYRMR